MDKFQRGDMTVIKGKYRLGNELLVFNNTKMSFYSSENEIDGVEHEILLIKYDDNNRSTLKRILDHDIKPLIDNDNQVIQKIIEVDEDENEKFFFIVYESLSEVSKDEYTYQDFKQCIETLDKLKKCNRQGFILYTSTVVKIPNHQIKIRFISLFRLLSVFNENIKSRRRIKDDIRSLADIFKDFLQSSTEGKEIFDKCRKGSYEKYCNLKEDLGKLPVEHNPDFSNIGITVDQRKIIDIDWLLDHLNKSCYWTIEPKKSKKYQIQIQWSTENISGRAYVETEKNTDNYGYLFIPHVNEYPESSTLEKGEMAPFNFESNNNHGSYHIDYFLGKFSNTNKLAELNSHRIDTVTDWKTLPETEKEYIEEKAFKVKYYKRELSNTNKLNVTFNLDEFKDWNTVKDKKNEEIMLSIDNEFIGKILDYKLKENKLIIKDFKGILEEIPRQGELIEDVQQRTSQYKKQIDACEKFKKGDIVNPNIVGILATPKRMPELPYIDIDNEKFEEGIINSDLKEDETQKNAVFDALHKKPIYLIQGPPGTGKTTVIVELIQQLIKQKKNMKILVVSQSNMAVDNVLKRLPKEILFMRFVGEHATKNDNISNEIKPHLFEEKLKEWIKKTIERSTENIEIIPHGIDPALSKFYDEFSREKEINNIEEFKKLYRKNMFGNYFEKKFGKADNLKKVNDIFHKELGEEYIKLNKIQKEWFAFIRNATSKKNDENISKLKNGSEDIDLQTAFAKSMNVLGATCIHIASAKYNQFNLKFDYMIMDESSKATAAEALVPITMSKNLVLIGDHKQLPPTVTQKKEVRQKVKEKLEDDGLDIDKIYGVSLFQKLFEVFEGNDQFASYKIMLNIQYRMPRQLGYLISNYIYEGKLKSPDIERLPDYDKSKAHCLPLKTPTVIINGEEIPNCIIFVTTSNQEDRQDNEDKYERCNFRNVTTIKTILDKLNECYKDKKIISDIGIIAAYRGQVKLLKQEIPLNKYSTFPRKIDINTVDQFQGSERDIIIYDIVRSNKGSSDIGFLENFRRINVAFSRARKLLIVVGDSEYILKRAKLSSQSEFKELVIKKMVEQLEKWGCIYNSIGEAINE